jgi:hypothetical protein
MSKIPEPKTDVGKIFLKRVEELADAAQTNALSVLEGQASSWYRPVEITSSLLEESSGADQIRTAFSREEQEKWFDDSTKDRADYGTVGDLAQIQLQGDFLACMERAFRARHQTACQSRIHPGARLSGHGHDFGVIKGSMLGYIKGINEINRGEQVPGVQSE